jgi:hypothetical protein
MRTDERIRVSLQQTPGDLPAFRGDLERVVARVRVRRWRRRATAVAVSTVVLAGVALPLGLLYGLTGSRQPGPAASSSSSSPLLRSLLSRPLHFPAVSPGEGCPASRGRSIDTSFFGGTALGSGPVRVLIADRWRDLSRGQVELGDPGVPGWFALQTLWFSMPGYDGPFVVRAKRLGASGPIEVQPGATGPGSGPLVVPAGPTANTQDGYRTVPGSTWVASPGCYAWQVDGQNFSEVIVVDALPFTGSG